MAELGSGNGTGYPGAIDTDSNQEVNSPAGGKTKARAEVPNDLAAAVVAIQTELGVNPAGTKTNVITFLEVAHNAEGTHKSAATYPLATISDFTNSNHDHSDAAGGGSIATINMIRDQHRGLIIKMGGTPDEQVDVDADEIMLQSTGGVSKRVTAVNLTIDNTNTAAILGTDTGAVGSDNWYYIWVWSGTSGDTGFISLSSDIATVQANVDAVNNGYSTYGGIVGAIRTDGTSDFEAIRKEGNRTQYTVTGANQRAVTTGANVGDPAVPTWVAVAVRGSSTHTVPPTAKKFIGLLNVIATSYGVTIAPNNSGYGAQFSATQPPPISLGGADDNTTQMFEFLLESDNIYWAVTFASGTSIAIHCLGWED